MIFDFRFQIVDFLKSNLAQSLNPIIKLKKDMNF
jgi:hypothetical protein